MLYTYIIRYHHFSGNVRLRSSFEEFFGTDKNIGSVLFPYKIVECLKALGIEEMDYLKNHSAMPYYQLFLDIDVYQRICQNIFYGNRSYTTKVKTQQSADSVVKSNRIFYCPECLKEKLDYRNIKIFHQINGVYVCPEHHCYLNNVPIASSYRVLNMKEWDMSVRKCETGGVLEQIAEDVRYIIDNPPEIDNTVLREQLFDEAVFRGAFRFGKWTEKARDIEWQKFYDNLPVEYKKFKARLDFKRLAASKKEAGADPIEYLLIIRSLFGSFEKFMEICF